MARIRDLIRQGLEQADEQGNQPAPATPAPRPGPSGTGTGIGTAIQEEVRNNLPGNDGGDTGPCPPGEVQHCWPPPCRCEAPDAMSKADKDTCNEENHPEPKECYWCDFDTQQWVRGWCGEAKPGGGGGAGGVRSGAIASTAAKGGAGGGGGSGSDDFLRPYILGALEQGTRYSPEALQRMYGEVTRQRSNATARGERAIREEAARRGMSRAGQTDAAIRRLREGAEAESGKQITGIQTDKINADWQDKMAAIDRGQQYLNSLRDNQYRYDLMGEQRKQFDANLALAYAQLSQQRSNLQLQLQSQWNMQRAQMGFNALAGGF